MLRSALIAASFLFALTAIARDDDKKEPAKLTLDLAGSVDDEKLASAAPESSVIASQKEWDKLAEAWGIKGTAKVDFDKELIVVTTTRGSRLTLSTRLDDKGDLLVLGLSTRDLRPGFRYAIKTASREGVKTVKGKPLPKE